MAHRGTTDHQSRHICFFQPLKRHRRRIDISVSNDRNFHCVRHGSDDLPIRFACVALLLRAPVNCETGNPLAF